MELPYRGILKSNTAFDDPVDTPSVCFLQRAGVAQHPHDATGPQAGSLTPCFRSTNFITDKAPLSKGLLIIPSTFSLLLALLFQHYQKFFTYNLQAVKEEFQIWRLLCGRTVCLDLKDTFCSSLLIYNFRIFERRYGSRKFSSFLLGSWMLSVMFDFVLVEAIEYSFGFNISSLPSGFLGPVFALFVPFYSSIPRVQVTQILGQFSITNKTLVYILGLQLLTSGSYIWIVALSGLISGMCYSSSLLKVYHILSVPSGIARIFAQTLEPIFSSAEPSNEFGVGMGATIDIQRQQRMELHDRQILISQVAQMRRQRQGGMVNWNRFFPPLRHRPNANYLDNHPTVHEGQPPAQVSEEQVARLMEMGFSRVDALEALRASNNDLNVATNFLLQH
ncbi:ubiquitin-associated domain-containing protein 2 isoform X4 [Crotalus tigris]|uniref:ubiquitin-associated domain-containing protein 2 isoform X4 n=1 Tax=Crotalus tigris TaxID=88082 RepID=UPI00192F9B2E|nr:ubiquitin-associated domain-containing protein 2 isoform X4 [Crotalus tigris]